VYTNYASYVFRIVVMDLEVLKQHDYSRYLGRVKMYQYEKELFHEFIYL
jgi:hypothetical protein